MICCINDNEVAGAPSCQVSVVECSIVDKVVVVENKEVASFVSLISRVKLLEIISIVASLSISLFGSVTVI